MSEYQRQQKQKYLRQNILERQLDAEQFMDFCQNDQGSVDIDSWSLAQLKDLVKRFIKYQEAKNDQFTGFQMTPEFSTSKNQAFDNWSSFVQQVPKTQQKQQTGLNNIDLDFLQMMGMSTPTVTKKQQPKPIQQIAKPGFSTISNNLQKPKPKNPNQQFLKKMQNQNFISVFNNPPINSSQGQIAKNIQTLHQPQHFPNAQQKKSMSSSANNIPPANNMHQNHSSPPLPIIKPERDYPSNIPQQNFIDKVKCRQISKNRIPSDNVFCNVTGHEIVNPNVFVPKFVLYTVTTTPLNVQVKRRLKDFEQLRNLLKKMFPTTQIPHLERYSRLSETQPHVIAKQKLYLESFLNSLLINPVLKCRILEDFLLCTDLDLIKKIFREFQKVEKPRGLQDLWTTSGMAKMNTNMASRKYMNQQQLYVDYVENSFNKLKAFYDQLMIYYQNTAKIISDIAEVYEQLRETTKTVNESFGQNLRFRTIQPMLGAVTHVHRQLSQSMQTQAKNIHTELKHMFKYEVQNISSLKQTMKTLSGIHEAYEKRSDKDAAKRQAYESKKLGQFKNGAELPSKHITYFFVLLQSVLKYQSAYAQNQFKDQVCRYMDQLTAKIGARFQIFSTLQVSIAADMDNVWRQFQQFVQNRAVKGH